MKPGLIQVFDGLRITTQHMNHLQGSFHSALQDIRQILGTGKVHSGFDVVKEGDKKITVMPGLAFDFQRNRIVCDEPKTVEVSIQDIDETQYVCVKYEQVEDGAVEGKPTLIWDSCSILMLKTLPDQKDNIIPIAALIRKEEDETFEIVSLTKGKDSPAEEEDDVVNSEKTEDADTKITKDNEVINAGMLEFENSEASVNEDEEMMNEIAGAETSDFTSSADDMRAPKSIESANNAEATSNVSSEESEPSPTDPAMLHPAFSIEQGVFRLKPKDETPIFIETEILEPLKEKLGEYTEAQVLYLPTLSEMIVPLNFRPISLSFDTVLKAEIGFNQISENDFEGTVNYHATGHGEATLSAEIVSQYGVATIQSQSIRHTLGASPLFSEITKEGIFQISFQSASNFSNELAWFQQLGLMISTVLNSKNGFHIISRLVWKGKVTEGMLENLKRQEPQLRWGADVAWKAIGELKHQ